jgi:hypothetical protein
MCQKYDLFDNAMRQGMHFTTKIYCENTPNINPKIQTLSSIRFCHIDKILGNGFQENNQH